MVWERIGVFMKIFMEFDLIVLVKKIIEIMCVIKSVVDQDNRMSLLKYF